MPSIPKGFGTKLGVAGAALLAVVAALTPFIDGAQNGDTRFYAALASGLAAVTVFGRMLQAAAQFINVNASVFDEPDFVDGDAGVADLDDQPSGLGKVGER